MVPAEAAVNSPAESCTQEDGVGATAVRVELAAQTPGRIDVFDQECSQSGD